MRALLAVILLAVVAEVTMALPVDEGGRGVGLNQQPVNDVFMKSREAENGNEAEGGSGSTSLNVNVNIIKGNAVLIIAPADVDTSILVNNADIVIDDKGACDNQTALAPVKPAGLTDSLAQIVGQLSEGTGGRDELVQMLQKLQNNVVPIMQYLLQSINEGK